ncbi:hypothetical protein [Streptomyces sp. NPDC003952]
MTESADQIDYTGILAARAAYDPSNVERHFDASESEDGNYPDPNSDTHYIACVAQQHAYSFPIPLGPDGIPFLYVANSGPDPMRSRWDYAEVAGWQETTLTAGGAQVSGSPLSVRGLTAEVEWDGKPVNFALVVFTDADGLELARGYTGPNGKAVCDGPALPPAGDERDERLAVLARGYTATFPGGGSGDIAGWQSSTGQGVIDTVSGVPRSDDQNLWRSAYTTAGGWGADGKFAAHKSAAAPALAALEDGTLVCAHRGARKGDKEVLPLRWTSYKPKDIQPLLDKVTDLKARRTEELAGAELEALEKEIEAATGLVDAARKWTPDAGIGGQTAWETPALGYLGGTLDCVYRTFPERGLPRLYSTSLATGGAWSEPRELDLSRVFRYGQESASAPAFAVYEGRLHLVFVLADSGMLVHLAREAGGARPANREDWTQADWNGYHLENAQTDVRWEAVKDAEGHPVFGPGVERVKADENNFLSLDGYPANLALAEYGGLLHLLYRQSKSDQRLWHSTYDGTKWSKGTALEGLTSRFGAALAVYDGKLHAVYPSPDDLLLRHAVYEDGKWGTGQTIAGHESNNTPALLTYREAGGAGESLILVHRGIDTYVAPVPVPYVPPKVKALHESAYSSKGSDYAGGGWTWTGHQIKLTRATFDNGSKGLVARWSADVQYYWGAFWYYDDGMLTGELRLRKNGSAEVIRSESVGTTDLHGLHESTVVWPDLGPGYYEVTLSRGRKNGGYWARQRQGDGTARASAEMDLWAIRVGINIPS